MTSRDDLPKVSVVIPSYNHAEFVGEAIDSVEAQESVDLELIIIDDGSQDGSPELLSERLARFKRGPSELVVQENRGAHEAINLGMSKARGEFVQILNSDDRFHPRRCAKMVDVLTEGGSDLAMSDVRVIDDEGHPAASGHPMSVWHRSAIRAFAEEPTAGFGLLVINAGVTTSNFMFRRSLLEKIGGFTPERLCHDWRFLLRAMLSTEPMRVDEPLVDYRFHGGNTAPRVMASRRAEGGTALREYLAAACAHPPENPLAPSPFWWPGFFDFFARSRRSWFSGELISDFLPQFSDAPNNPNS